MPANYSHDILEMMFFKVAPKVGQQVFTTAGYWTVPVGVTKICAVAVGSALVRVSNGTYLVNAMYNGDGGSGGDGGLSGDISYGVMSGGGGAGGYSGNGGNGGASGYAGLSGSGGGGGGGASRGGGDTAGLRGYPGGGVGLLGIGSSGAGGTYAFTDGGGRSAGLGGGGSGGGVGNLPYGTSSGAVAGGLYGGGSSMSNGAPLRYINDVTVIPGESLQLQMEPNISKPGLRIMWGGGRSFPSNAGDM